MLNLIEYCKHLDESVADEARELLRRFGKFKDKVESVADWLKEGEAPDPSANLRFQWKRIADSVESMNRAMREFELTCAKRDAAHKAASLDPDERKGGDDANE